MKPDQIGSKARAAAFWNIGFSVVRDLLQFGVMLVLVRLVEPAAYGKFALVTSVIGFVSVISYNHFLSHIVQSPGLTPGEYQQHFVVGLAIALTLFAITNVVAAFFWLTDEYRVVAPLVHLMSLTFLNAFPCDFRIKLLERELNWKRLRALHLIGLILSSVLAIAMGLAGFGVYALLVPSFLINIPFTIDLFVGIRWRPHWRWSLRGYGAAWRFGVARIASAAAVNGRQLVESMTLAGAMGLSGLGIFNRAAGLAQMFGHKVAFQLIYAIYPALTQLQEPERVMRVNAMVFRIVVLTTVPLAWVFSALSLPIVVTVYGAKWIDVAEILPFAMWMGVAASLAHTANMLLLSRQQSRACVLADVAIFLGTCAALVWIMPLGAVYYLAGLAIVYFSAALGMASALRSLGALTASSLVWSISSAVIASLLAYGACEMTYWFLDFKATVPQAIAYGLSFLTLYIAVLRLLFPNELRELVAYMPARARVARILHLSS